MVSSNRRRILSWQVQRRLNATLVLFFVLFCLGSSSAFAACHAVTPSGSGSRTGADWSDSFAGIPSTLTRGDIYYFADGNYGTYTFSQADSGTTTIEFRKAQSYDDGSSCSPSIAAGWNTSTMGSSQAVFAGTGSALTISADYFTMNGNGTSTASGCGGAPGSTVAAEPPTPSDCGFRLQGTGGTSSGSTNVVWMGFNSSHQTFEYIELLASGTNPSDLEMFASNGNFTLTHSYEHNSGCVYLQDLGSNTLVDHSYFWGTEVYGSPGGVCHGQAEYETGGNNNGVRSNNVYRDITGTAVWTFGQGGQNDNWKFYNNVIFFSSPQLSFGGLSDATWDCINGNLCTNFTIVQNTIVNCLANGVFGSSCGIGWGDSSSGGSFVAENNLWYSNPGAVGITTNGTTVTEDYNSFLNSPTPGTGAHDVKVASGAPNPFADWQNSNFNLTSENADWNNRLALSSTYNTDAAGTTFATDRGAYQSTVAGSAPAPPTGLTVVVE